MKALSENRVKQIVVPILRAMNYLKQNGIVHKDIKPDNIMFEC